MENLLAEVEPSFQTYFHNEMSTLFYVFSIILQVDIMILVLHN